MTPKLPRIFVFCPTANLLFSDCRGPVICCSRGSSHPISRIGLRAQEQFRLEIGAWAPLRCPLEDRRLPDILGGLSTNIRYLSKDWSRHLVCLCIFNEKLNIHDRGRVRHALFPLPRNRLRRTRRAPPLLPPRRTNHFQGVRGGTLVRRWLKVSLNSSKGDPTLSSTL